MDSDTDTDLSSHSNEFTPINSPIGQRLGVANAAMNEENDNEDDQPLSIIKTKEDEVINTYTTPVSTAKQGTPTSSKRTRKPATSKTPYKKSKKETDTDAGNGIGTPEGGTPARAALPPIPTSLATASEMDRMILRLRDEEKQPWAQINKLFTEETGIKVGSTTLRLRWSTMKANFVGITTEDEARLLRLKKEIEDKFEQEKWHRIVEAIQSDGGEKYPIAALQKKFKELSKNPAVSAQGATSGTGDDEEE
ncbi:hypothetical protein BDW68DRAFT_172761 [Aspergillus falconensis]